MMIVPNGLLLSDDLIFASRITATARAHGIEVDVAKTMADFIRVTVEKNATGYIIDLQNETLDLPELMIAVHGKYLPGAKFIGYGSHVVKETLQAARDAGFDLVIARSKFVKHLETSIENWLNINHRE